MATELYCGGSKRHQPGMLCNRLIGEDDGDLERVAVAIGRVNAKKLRETFAQPTYTVVKCFDCKCWNIFRRLDRDGAADRQVARG